MIDPGLDIAVEVNPTPRAWVQTEVQISPIVDHDARKLDVQMVGHGGVRSRRPDGKEGEGCGDKDRGPVLRGAWFRGSFVRSHYGLTRQGLAEFLIDRTQGGGGLGLEFDRPAWRTRLVHDLAEKAGRSTFGLLEALQKLGVQILSRSCPGWVWNREVSRPHRS